MAINGRKKPGGVAFEASNGRPAGSHLRVGRALRLDPFALPVRYPAKDSGRTGKCARWITINRERVVLRRAVRGMR